MKLNFNRHLVTVLISGRGRSLLVASLDGLMYGDLCPGETSGVVLQVPQGLDHHAYVVRPHRVGPRVVRSLPLLLGQVGSQNMLKR